MRFIAITILTILIVVFLNPVAPYWMVMIGIFLVATLIKPTGGGAFFGGALGMGLAWIGQSIYIGLVTASPLPDRMGELMGMGSGMTLVAITGVLGFLLGGLSAWSGTLFRKLFKKTPENVYKG
jgi:hypothetical protein